MNLSPADIRHLASEFKAKGLIAWMGFIYVNRDDDPTGEKGNARMMELRADIFDIFEYAAAKREAELSTRAEHKDGSACRS